MSDMLCPTCNTPVALSDVECPSCKRKVRTSPAELDGSGSDAIGGGGDVALATSVDADIASGQSFMSWLTGMFSWGHAGGDAVSDWGAGGGDSGDGGSGGE